MQAIRATFTSILVVLLIAFATGCSGNGNGGAVLPDTASPDTAQSMTGAGLWGSWQVAIDPYTQGVEITQLRQCDYILNVLGFLEPPALTGMTINFDTLAIDFDNQLISVDVVLTHPLVSPEGVFQGFDVRGIVFGPAVTNADGLTVVMNPEDFTSVPFGYQDGLLGAPDSYANYDGLWGYRYFADNLDMDDDLATFFSVQENLDARGIFSEGTQNVRHYELAWGGSGYDMLIFNYAVYANYNWPVGDPPYELEDFLITTANCQEAFCASITETYNTLNYYEGAGTGMISLDVEVWDWQGQGSTDVTIESPAGGLAAAAYTSTDAGTTDFSVIYHFVDLAPVPPIDGTLGFMIKVTDPMTFGASWFLELLPESNAMYNEQVYNCFAYTATVTNYAQAEPPDPVGDLTLSTGRTGQTPTVEVTGVTITWTDPGDPDIVEYGIYVDESPYTGLDDDFVLLGISTTTSYTHDSSSLVPLDGNAAYSYTVRSRSIATGGAAVPDSEAGDSQLAFIELENFEGGTAAGGGTWTSQSDDGVVLWTDLPTGTYNINGESFGYDTTWNLAGGSEAATEWTMLTSPEIPDVTDANRAIFELNHDQRGINFSSFASRGYGTYSTPPTSGTNDHTVGDFDWCNENMYGFTYNRIQGWDSTIPNSGPSWALVFLEPEACMEALGYNQWAYTWDGAHSTGVGPFFSGGSWFNDSCADSGYVDGRRYVGIGFGRYWDCTANTMDAIVHDDIAVIVD